MKCALVSGDRSLVLVVLLLVGEDELGHYLEGRCVSSRDLQALSLLATATQQQETLQLSGIAPSRIPWSCSLRCEWKVLLSSRNYFPRWGKPPISLQGPYMPRDRLSSMHKVHPPVQARQSPAASWTHLGLLPSMVQHQTLLKKLSQTVRLDSERDV
jgi:hypothetical protein